jgi:hypothetical protein
MTLTPDQIQTYHREGYLVVEGMYPDDEMEAAQAAAEQFVYGKSFREYLADYDAGLVEHQEINATTGDTKFPLGVPPIDRLVENDDYLDALEQLLGGKPSYNRANLFVRFAATDTLRPDHPWQGYHIDHDTSSFLPPADGHRGFDHIISAVYLHDVPVELAPTHVIPRSHLRIASIIPDLIADDNWQNRAVVKDLRRISGLAEPVPVSAPRGSAVFMSSYLLHSAVPFQNRRGQRALWAMQMSNMEHISFSRLCYIFDFNARDRVADLFTRTTPRVRSMLGWPEPGHPYYTDQTIALLEAHFPCLDTTPYRRAMRDGR